MQYVLFNSLANNKMGEKRTRDHLAGKLEGDVEYKDVISVDIKEFFTGLTADDRVILSGGDGTINNFINLIEPDEIPCRLDYIPTGNGNDFKADVGMDGDFIDFKKYMYGLPTVTVNGMTKKFINGIGYGIDGYCCEVGDELKKKSPKPVNYAGIAIKGVLFHFKPRNATVIVDGVETKFKKVFLVPTMKGRFYGGGMMVAPEQDRFDPTGKLSVVTWHDTGRLLTLMRFPKIFKGQHVKYNKMITIMTGKEITVKFDMPTALQIDGETVLGVSEYTVKA